MTLNCNIIAIFVKNHFVRPVCWLMNSVSGLQLKKKLKNLKKKTKEEKTLREMTKISKKWFESEFFKCSGNERVAKTCCNFTVLKENHICRARLLFY